MLYPLKIKSNIVLTTHPIGMKKFVSEQIDYVKSQGKFSGAKNALVVGAGSGYGLASRISLAFGCGTHTCGISYSDKPRNDKFAAGFLGSTYFLDSARKAGLQAGNIYGDGFSDEMKNKAIDYIKENMGGKIDLLVYSVATGKRKDPITGEVYASTLKALGKPYDGMTVDIASGELQSRSLEVATAEEVADTVKVMGGEDIKRWIEFLDEAGCLDENFKVITYSYVGTPITFPIYREGSIGQAKLHLEKTIKELDDFLKAKYNGEAIVTSSKAVLTKASVFIPTLPIYASLLYKVMKEQGTHETPIMHKYRMFKDMIYGDKRVYDESGILRVDHLEIDDKVQNVVVPLMQEVNFDNYRELLDVEQFISDVIRLNGYGFSEVDYDADVDVSEIWEMIDSLEN